MPEGCSSIPRDADHASVPEPGPPPRPIATLEVTLGSLYFVGFGREVHAHWPSGVPFLDFHKRTHGELGAEWWAFGVHAVVSKV